MLAAAGDAAGDGPGPGGAAAGGPAARVPLRELMDDRLLDALLDRSRDEAGGLRLTGEGSMLGELVKAVLERALEAELTAHLGYERGERAGRGGGAGNYRNGTIAKTVQTGVGPVGLAVPRDRAGTFEPLLVPKRAGRVAGGLDDMVISLYAHGMSVRDILHHLEQVYGTQLSHETVSRITDQVLEEVRAWQSRPLDPVYAVAFLDAIMVKVRDNARRAEQARLPGRRHRRRRGEARAGHLAGQDRAGHADRRARAPGSGARVMTDLTQPGRAGHPDRLLRRAARVRGRHLRRVPRHRGAALRSPPDQERAAAGGPPRRRGGRRRNCAKIYTAPGRRGRLARPAEFADSPWGRKYPQAVRVLEAAWEAFTPFLAFSPAVRKLLYTTNAIESLNYQLRKVTKARGHFPNDDAVVKLLWLAIINIEDKRARERAGPAGQTGKRSDQPARLVEGQRVMGWREALNELDSAYPGRLRWTAQENNSKKFTHLSLQARAAPCYWRPARWLNRSYG